MELGEALRNTEYFLLTSGPCGGLGLSAKGLLSSVASGDTPFQRKRAIALRHVPLVTQRSIP